MYIYIYRLYTLSLSLSFYIYSLYTIKAPLINKLIPLATCLACTTATTYRYLCVEQLSPYAYSIYTCIRRLLFNVLVAEGLQH